MFEKLPDLLDKNFAVGFLLPAAGWLFGILLTLADFNILHSQIQLTQLDTLSDTVLAIIVVWLAAIALLALNRPLIRFMEGYGKYHPFAWRSLWKRRFHKQAAPFLELQSQIAQARLEGSPRPTTPADYGRRLVHAVEHFPDEERWVLPTRFGNTFRAIEVYSRVVYGLDSIPAWPRLEAIFPEQFSKLLAEAKAQMDFAVNVTYAGFFIALLYCAFALVELRFPNVWLPFLAAGCGVVGYSMSLSSLSQYGNYVKSAFDLYRGLLAEQLGYEMPRSAEAEREMWTALNNVMIFRSAAAQSRLVKFRKPRDQD